MSARSLVLRGAALTGLVLSLTGCTEEAKKEAGKDINGTSPDNKAAPVLGATPVGATTVPCPLLHNIKGKLFWNRTWEYTTSKTVAAIVEYLPGAKVELYVQKKGEAALALHATTSLTDAGEFSFTAIPDASKVAMKVFLEYRSGVVVVKGKSNAVTDADFEVKTGQVVWHQFDLDVAKITGPTEVDLGDVEIKRAHFIDICDAYKSVWFGHTWIKDNAGHDLGICQINYPEPTTSTSNASVQMQLLKDDLKDRSVILHEYGHFIGHEILGGLVHPGYGYNDDAVGQHGRDTKEHYEAAWNEGHATFLSCAICDGPIYRDGYDSDLTYKLDTDNTLVGPHSEGSIQEALWRVYKVHGTSFKDGFWKAFSDKSKRTVRTIFELYDSWKDLACPSPDKLKEALTKFNMQYGYHYTKRFTCVVAPATFDAATTKFLTIDELYDAFGKTGGGTLADFKEEFYNRNKQFNAGALGAGSTPADPKVTTGQTYIVPDRFEIS